MSIPEDMESETTRIFVQKWKTQFIGGKPNSSNTEYKELFRSKFASCYTRLKVIFMGLTKIQVTLNVYVTSFERLVKDIITSLFIKKWIQIEKENVVSVEDSMLPEIIRIQSEGFGTKSLNGVKRYSKRMKKIFYVIKS